MAETIPPRERYLLDGEARQLTNDCKDCRLRVDFNRQSYCGATSSFKILFDLDGAAKNTSCDRLRKKLGTNSMLYLRNYISTHQPFQQ